MAAPGHDLYETHFANIRCSRATFLAFLNYTVVAREGQDGTGQALNRSKKDVLRAMRAFAQDTNAVLLVPAYRATPDKLNELLPQGLMHLTDANTTDLPERFAAFAEALTARAAALTAAPGLAAEALLDELTTATKAKDAGLKVEKATIGSIGGQRARATELLWQTHCVALGALWEHPEQAELYFNYGLLPRRNPNRVAKAAAPAPQA